MNPAVTYAPRPTTPSGRGGYPAQMRAIRHVSAAIGLLALVALLAACAGTSSTNPPPSDTPAATSSGPSVAPATPPASAAPATPADSAAPSAPAEESAAPPSAAAASDSPPPGGGPAAACSGTDNNRDFYADAASALAFSVYCPVLPSGWFVQQGDYQLKGGGQLHITYKGPAGASLELIERGPCGEGDDCIPSGTEEGERSFGDLPATLVALGDGGLMIAAENVTDGRWWIIGQGIDEVALTQIASDLVLVGR
jgi:hypothetical protein